MSKTLISLDEERSPPLLKIRLPFSHRLNCFISLWVLKVLAVVVYAVARLVHPPLQSIQPTLIKRYPCRPSLQTRIFYPPKHQPGDMLPLYLSIHGGCFAVGDAQQDDEWCTMWAQRTGMLVVSLDYSKAPLHSFPTGVFDIVALAEAVISDPSLPIDKTKVAIGGFSAGGNLALGASQLPGLKGAIKAALTFYPMVDWSRPPHKKLEMRPYTDGPRDSLASSSYWFDWGYVSPGQNRRDPVLSPAYARRVDLPPWIYVVGAQWDMLRAESQSWIHGLAGVGDVEDLEADFEEGTYKWTLARGCSHGFTHHFGYSTEERRRREEKCKPIYEEAAEWMQEALTGNGFRA